VEGCSNWNDLSFLGSLIRYKKCAGKSRIPYKSDRKHLDLINILAENVPSNAIHLVKNTDKPISVECILEFLLFQNTEVTKIIQGEEKLSVITKDGVVYSADYAVVTCSLGVLKDRAASLFDPQLPLKKFRAIETIELGIVNKIFLEFENPWWTGGKNKNKC